MAAKDCQLIESLERRWCDALCSRDLDQLSELVHPDFVLIGMRSTGPFEMDREEWLEAIQRRDVVGIDLEIKDAAVFDAMLIGTVKAKWRLKYLGRVIEDCVLLTDVWVKDGKDWRVVRRHSTPSPASSCN
jgi:ketosteroid isomerase-like protein